MATLVHCPYCGSLNTKKTTNGKFSNVLAKAGSLMGGVLLQAATGVPGALTANIGYRNTWHQY